MTNTTIATVDMPATIRIGSDRYAAKVTKVSPSGKTVEVAFARDGETMTFRWARLGKVSARLEGRFVSGNYRLTLGEAVTDLDASF